MKHRDRSIIDLMALIRFTALFKWKKSQSRFSDEYENKKMLKINKSV